VSALKFKGGDPVVRPAPGVGGISQSTPTVCPVVFDGGSRVLVPEECLEEGGIADG
jgi:hypothetical protein